MVVEWSDVSLPVKLGGSSARIADPTHSCPAVVLRYKAAVYHYSSSP